MTNIIIGWLFRLVISILFIVALFSFANRIAKEEIKILKEKEKHWRH